MLDQFFEEEDTPPVAPKPKRYNVATTGQADVYEIYDIDTGETVETHGSLAEANAARRRMNRGF